MLILPLLPLRARSETLERMNRIAFSLAALALALPLAAQAQAFRCTDASGGVLYTDQPCAGGDLVVPALTEEELEQRRQADEEAQARRAAERQQELEAERLRLERERLELEYYYVKNCSLYLDTLCILRTVLAVITRSGAQ